MRKNKHTNAILLSVDNVAEIANFESIRVGSVANMMARELRVVDHINLDHFILFGYETLNGDVYRDWMIIDEQQLAENFNPVTSDINNKVVQVFYKD